MNKRIRQAALKLLQLQEEFTRKELKEAAVFLSSGETETLIELLSAKSHRRRERRAVNTQNGDGLSKVVQDLKETDPQRYELLARFEVMLRRETILPTLEEIRKIGTSISKDFQTAKSRKETIPRLMAVVGKMPLGVLQEKLGKVIEESKAEPSDRNAYRNLVEFLITGSKQH